MFVTLGDFSEELKKGIAREFQDFGVPLILDGRPAGSGVLVQIDDVYGILTAEHVVYNPIGPAFDNSRSSKQVLSVPLTRYEIETVTPAAWTDTVGKYLSW